MAGILSKVPTEKKHVLVLSCWFLWKTLWKKTSSDNNSWSLFEHEYLLRPLIPNHCSTFCIICEIFHYQQVPRRLPTSHQIKPTLHDKTFVFPITLGESFKGLGVINQFHQNESFPTEFSFPSCFLCPAWCGNHKYDVRWLYVDNHQKCIYAKKKVFLHKNDHMYM